MASHFFQIVDVFKCYKIKEKYVSKKFKTMDHFWIKYDLKLCYHLKL